MKSSIDDDTFDNTYSVVDFKTVFSPYTDGKSNIILLRGLEYFDFLL